ncbi:hypothetical protein BJ508DRAFT_74564 [Ascobolus immersus RN42]|uniref:Uncharacterized protein n=1 Tax=Ascobolus immersus RN42 TaxID=1160509 RepID=A0A3N4IGD4_ASCIM|nr:hypothetical protein BJ508DRAFT_74564 [Ascobolus immersus RN42]
MHTTKHSISELVSLVPTMVGPLLCTMLGEGYGGGVSSRLLVSDVLDGDNKGGLRASMGQRAAFLFRLEYYSCFYPLTILIRVISCCRNSLEVPLWMKCECDCSTVFKLTINPSDPLFQYSSILTSEVTNLQTNTGTTWVVEMIDRSIQRPVDLRHVPGELPKVRLDLTILM